MSSLVPRIQQLVFEDGQLQVAKEMREAMKGTCLSLKEKGLRQRALKCFQGVQ